ncbi:fimbrial biogenesis outer membrane usher protein [Enterobacter roggenkampii]|nr:fimbrial biogenesis outer membrane usher protein [Enterobacter roggenkampii]
MFINQKKSVVSIVAASWFVPFAHAEMYFPPEMITIGGNSMVNLEEFRADGTQPPGKYQVDIFLNGNNVGSQYLQFDSIDTGNITEIHPVDNSDHTGLIPCLTRRELEKFGVKVELYPDLMDLDTDKCINISTFIPDSFARFNFQKMKLDISVPQIAFRAHVHGYIEPEYWDEGINAALMNYNFSAMHRLDHQSNDNNYFLNLESGINVGPWRLRDQRTWNHTSNQSGRVNNWQRQNTYAERAIIPLRSNLVIGEGTSNGEIFDSSGFRGFSLVSNDNMYPDSQRGYSPVIRGVAMSNAEVIIRQNGYIIYKTSVAPGAFEFNDLNPMHGNGDLEVTVIESSGTVNVFTIPHASVPQLLRQGRVKYEVTAGRLRNSGTQYDTPIFAQGTLSRGLPHDVTLYGGSQGSKNYLSTQLGTGINLGRLGAVSADITHADSTLVDGSRHHGQSARFLYAQGFQPTGTNLRLVGYRYSTKGFYTLDETALKSMRGNLYDPVFDEQGNPINNDFVNSYSLYNNKKSRIEANINQSLGSVGSLSLTGLRQTYWNSASSYNSLQAGFSSRFGPVSYFLNYAYTQQKSFQNRKYEDHYVSLSFSVPLDKVLSPRGREKHSVYATGYTSHDKNGNSGYQGGLNGTLLEDENLAWNMAYGYARHKEAGNAGLDYRGSYGNANAGYSYSGDYQRLNYGLSGGVLLHSNGVTFGQPLNGTSVLVSADGASNVSILNETGVKTDWRGYAIKPYATAYRENKISIDVDKLDQRSDVEGVGSTKVVPTKGAIVRTDFSVLQGVRTLITLMKEGKPLPFGTMVTSGKSSGIVDDNGQVYLPGMQHTGVLNAKWGNSLTQKCEAHYNISESDLTSDFVRLKADCK